MAPAAVSGARNQCPNAPATCSGPDEPRSPFATWAKAERRVGPGVTECRVMKSPADP